MAEILFTGVNLNELLERIGKIIETKLENNSPRKIKSLHQSEYLIRQEVASLLKVTFPTLNDWPKSGLLQSYKIGNRVLDKPNEIETAVK